MSAPADVTADLVIVGGGLGGCAAAVAAADAGVRVILTEGTDRVGGQVTSQLVSALDEHATVEDFPGSASYGAFRAAVRDACNGQANPGGGWVSRLCFPPAVGGRVLMQWLAERGVTVITGVRPVATDCARGVLRTVTFQDDSVLGARVFADATELGDLIALAQASWTVGSEGPAHGEAHALATQDEHAVQAITWCAVVEHVPGADFAPVPRPDDYRRWRDRYAFDVQGGDGCHRYRMFTDGPDGRPPFWTYRRLSTDPDAALLNWVANDYADVSLIAQPERARREARQQTLGFVHWLQTEAPHDEGTGRGYASLRLCPEVAGTVDGLAVAPYVRESRRLGIAAPVTGNDLALVPGSARAAPVQGSVGVVHYAADLHSRVGVPETVYAPTAPFQVPLRALVADRPTNLLAAAKNLGATQVAASAYRVHSGEWMVGEAAGTLAAYCVRHGVGPTLVRDDPAHVARLQRVLVGRGVAIAWALGVSAGDPLFPAVQLLAAAGGLAGVRRERLEVDPDGPVDDRDRAALHVAAIRSLPGLAAAPAAPAAGRWRDVVRHYGHLLDCPPRRRSSA